MIILIYIYIHVLVLYTGSFLWPPVFQVILPRVTPIFHWSQRPTTAIDLAGRPKKLAMLAVCGLDAKFVAHLTARWKFDGKRRTSGFLSCWVSITAHVFPIFPKVETICGLHQRLFLGEKLNAGWSQLHRSIQFAQLKHEQNNPLH